MMSQPSAVSVSERGNGVSHDWDGMTGATSTGTPDVQREEHGSADVSHVDPFPHGGPSNGSISLHSTGSPGSKCGQRCSLRVFPHPPGQLLVPADHAWCPLGEEALGQSLPLLALFSLHVISAPNPLHKETKTHLMTSSYLHPLRKVLISLGHIHRAGVRSSTQDSEAWRTHSTSSAFSLGLHLH